MLCWGKAKKRNEIKWNGFKANKKKEKKRKERQRKEIRKMKKKNENRTSFPVQGSHLTVFIFFLLFVVFFFFGQATYFF